MKSWRVNKKIFATVPSAGDFLHIFVREDETNSCVEEDPEAFEELRWGNKLVGLRVKLAKAKTTQVKELLEQAWRLKAPKRLLMLAEKEGLLG